MGHPGLAAPAVDLFHPVNRSFPIHINTFQLTNAELITRFYDSFSRGDAESMAGCYAEDIIFADPAFGELKGADAMNMWRMLIQNGKGKIKITCSDVKADSRTGSANWVAEYTFSKSGRHVINKIAARFEFENGKIVRHTDDFDLWKWSRQALGWKGYLLGWTSLMKNKIQFQANESLKKYNASK